MAQVLQRDEDEEIVMTPLKPKEGRRIIRVERMTREKINSDRVHYVAGGTYMGIVVNKAVNVKPKKAAPQTLRRFTAHVGNQDVIVKEIREVRFWFKSNVSVDRREDQTEDFFRELLNPKDFPKDYMSFIKRILRLVQAYPSIRSVEFEIRPFSDGEETLDVRGQPLNSPLNSPSSTSAAAAVAAADQPLVTSPKSPSGAAKTVAVVRQFELAAAAADVPKDAAEFPAPPETSLAAADNGTGTRKKKAKKKVKKVDGLDEDVVEVTEVVDTVTKKKKKKKLPRKDQGSSSDQQLVESTELAVVRGGLAELDFDHEQNEVHEEYIQVQRSTTIGNYDFDSDGRIHYDNELHMNGQGVHEEVVQVKQAVRTGYSGNPYYAAELQMQPDFHGNGDVFADDGYRPDIIASTENIVSSQQQQQQQQQQLSVSEQPDVKLRHGEQRHSSRKGRSSSRRKSSGSETETMASKLQKLLGTMEDAFPTALGVDDIVRITKIKRSDVETLLVELSQAKSIVEVENGLWIRAQVQRSAAVRLSKRSSKTPQDPAARQHEFRMVGHMPVLPPKEQPTIAIITSLYCEKLAVDAVMDYKTTYIRCKKGGEGQVYTIGKIGKHRVVSTKLSRIGRDAGATTATGNTVTRLLGAFGKVEHVLLVGVAGGVAYCDDDSRHVRLGDVVISRPVRPGAPVYLQLTEADDDPRAGWDAGAIVRNWSPTDATLTGIAERLQRSKNFYKHIDQYIKQGLAELEACDTTDGPESASSRDFLSSFRRPPPDTDPRPYIVGSKSKSGDVPPPEHPVVQPGSVRDQRGADRPVAHFGAIAAGRSLTRDAAARRRVADVDGVRAVDVGFQAVFESIDGNRKDSYAVVRGVCDYLDGTSSETQQQRGGGSREWKQYSSLVAAAAAKCLVLGIVAASDDDDDDDD